jgi:pimeloyl-ACP methyl ester carboxylesterase
MNAHTYYRTLEVGELDIFYREAGPKYAPIILLLHGYPSSSHMFRDLIGRLADGYRVIAPDLPGFGLTKAPPRGRYDYTFANLAAAINGFTEALGLERYALYVFDYGAPTGFRLAAMHPGRVTGIVTQNGNAYLEGLLPAWDPVRAYWEAPTPEKREALRALQTLETTRWQYFEGVPAALQDRISPDAIANDQAILDRDGSAEIQLDLIGDYKSNVAPTRCGRLSSGSTGRHCLRFGAGMIRSSAPRVPKLSGATSRMPRCTFLIPGTSRSRRTHQRSPR